MSNLIASSAIPSRMMYRHISWPDTTEKGIPAEGSTHITISRPETNLSRPGSNAETFHYIWLVQADFFVVNDFFCMFFGTKPIRPFDMSWQFILWVDVNFFVVMFMISTHSYRNFIQPAIYIVYQQSLFMLSSVTIAVANWDIAALVRDAWPIFYDVDTNRTKQTS